MTLARPIRSINISFKDKHSPVVKTVRGARNIQTIQALVKAGTKGITALEVNSWAFRLASYIYKLRHIYGLKILTKEEPHVGGTHARYVLLTPVTVEELQ